MQLRYCILSLGLLCSVVLQAQEEVFSASYSEKSVYDILKEIKSETGIKLAYDVGSMRYLEFTGSFDKTPINEVFNQLLANSGYEAVLIKGTWLIIPIYTPPQASEPDEIRRRIQVAGRLYDRVNGESLPFANVSIRGEVGGAMTNLDGFFDLQEVEVDTVLLCVSYVGYRSRCIPLSKIKDTEHISIGLDRAETYLNPVEVYGKPAYDMDTRAGHDMIRMDARSIARMSAGAQPDLFRSVQTLPGISSGDALDAQLYIRGANEDENLVRWDGFTLYHLDHLFGAFSTLNPQVIKQTQILKGPYGSQYGGRSGGVLDITGKSGDKYRWHTRADFNLINASLMVEGPLSKRDQFLLSFRRSHTDLISSGLYEDILDRIFVQSVTNISEDLVSENVESDFHYYDMNLKWSSDLSEEDRLSFSYFQGNDNFDRSSSSRFEPEGNPIVLNDLQEDYSTWGNVGLGLQWSRNPGESRSHNTSIGWSQYSSDYYFIDTQQDVFNGFPLLPVSDASLQSNQVRDLSLSHGRSKAMPKGRLDYGLQNTYLEVSKGRTQRIRASSTLRILDTTRYSNQSSFYFDRHLADKKESYALRFGGRITYNSFTNKIYFEPRARIDYWLNPALQVYLATGNYIQQIRRTSEQNLFLRQADQWSLSARDGLPESRSFHSAIGITWQRQDFSASVEAFHKQLQGVIFNQEQYRLLSAYTEQTEELVSGTGSVSGLDLLLRWDHRGHSAWVSYSYTLSSNRISAVNDGTAFPSPFNKPHDLKWVYNLRHKDLLFHVEGIHSSGYPYTPVLGFFEGPSGDPFIVYGDDLSSRLPALFRVDLSLSKKLSYKQHDLVIGLGVYNATDHVNIRARSYAVNQVREEIPDELRIKAIDLELIGLSPTFTMTFDLK